MTRRVYSIEYKREAVQLVTTRGVSVAQAAKDLDVHATVLRRWVKEFGSGDRAAFPENGQLRPEDEEIRSLRREVPKLKAERDILKRVVIVAPLVRATMTTPALPEINCHVRVRGETSRGLAGQLDV